MIGSVDSSQNTEYSRSHACILSTVFCLLKPARKAKGFIHTLEAILAAFIVIGFVIFLLPALRDAKDSGQIERFRMSERLMTLDSSGDLSSYVSGNSSNLSGLSDKIASEASPSYNYSIVTVSYAADTVTGNRQIDIQQGANNILEVDISAWNSTAVLLPETTVWDSGGPKDTMVISTAVSLSSARASPTHVVIKLLSVAEYGEYRYRIKKFETNGTVPDNTSVWTSTYMPQGTNIRVFNGS